MRKSITPNPAHFLYPLFLIAFILLATSCREPATPTIEQPPSSTSPDQVSDLPASIPKISPGQHLRFDTISLEQGLSQSTVFCMLQDSQGFMWFGTEEGLNKYDGYTFTIYQHDPEDPNSMGGNRISAILEDDSGTLWIGTDDGGLDHYDREFEQFTHYRSDSQDPSSLSDDEVTALYQDQDGVIWIGTNGGGLDRFDQENERFIHYQHDPDNPNSLSSNTVSAIYEDQDGVLWIGTDGGGLNRFDSKYERWQRYVNNPSNPDSLSHDHITAIFEDQSGSLWVGTNGGGLNRLALPEGNRDDVSETEGFDQENQRFIHYRHDPDDPGSLSNDEITAIYQDRDGLLWIGTSGGGGNIFNPDKETFVNFQNIPGDSHSLSSNMIISIFQDREGGLWFGTHGGGVNKLGVGRRNFAHYKNDPNNPNSPSDNMVWVLYQDREGDLWIGTMLGGLDRFNRETGNWRHYHHDPNDPGSLSDDWVSAIYEDRSGVLWIGTRSGLDRFEPETDSALGEGTFTHYQADPDGPPQSPSNNVIAIYQGDEGDFWIGTEGGLYRFDPGKESWSQSYRHYSGCPDSLSSDMVLAFLKDRDGMLWIGAASAGLVRFDPEKETFTQYQNDPGDPHSLSSNAVLWILQDREGVLWISTLGGLDKLVLSEAEGLDPGTGTFTHYREKDGIPNDTAHCTLEDGDGNLWVSTNKGLSRFDPQREMFRNYDVTDGLQSNEFNACSCHMSDNGEMFFGGINGFNAFFPDQVTDNTTIPPIVLTAFTLDSEETDLDMAIDRMTEITIKWPADSFEFEFAALSYAQPEKNQYTYLLEGFDKDWNQIGTRRYGKYTNLPGGTYSLRLTGSNNDGIWNEVGTALTITVLPPFWGTWGFRGLVILLLLAAIVAGYRLRVRSLEARSRHLESQVQQRTAELHQEAIQRAQVEQALRESEREKAVTAERNRLARALHDSVTQSLYSLTLLAAGWQRLAKNGKLDSIDESLGEIGEVAQQALKEMRLLVYELRPPVLEEEGLLGAIHHRLGAVEKRAGIEARLEAEDVLDLPSEVEAVLYYIVVEALNNALKHAQATSVTVRLFSANEKVTLEIADDGQGFDLSTIGESRGLGLVSMQERADQLGASLSIDSAPDKGTRVKVEVLL